MLLVGSGESCALLIRALRIMPEAPYRPLAILDVGKAGNAGSILGVPVVGLLEDLRRAVQRLIDEGRPPSRLILTETIDGSRMRWLLCQAESMGLTISRMPNPLELRAAVETGGQLEFPAVPLHELLGRPQAAIDCSVVAELLANRFVLVTGAGGSIGSELTRRIAMCRPERPLILDSSEFNLYKIDSEIAEQFSDVPRTALLADVRDRPRLHDILARYSPHLVFHAAAVKHVPMVEANPIEGVLTNALGTRNVADAAWECGAIAMVLISSDKAVNPTNVMGATKRLAEFYCQAFDVAAGHVGQDGKTGDRTRFMTVRFGNVLGSSGSVVPLFQRQLAAGGPLTITHPDMRRYFMTIREASDLVLSGHGTWPEAGRRAWYDIRPRYG